MSDGKHTAPIVRWYVGRYSDRPERGEFTSETEQTLGRIIGGRFRREAKHTLYGQWYETEKGAMAAIAAANAAAESRKADRRLRDAAPDLLEALRVIVREVEAIVDDGTLPKEALAHPAMGAARAAIAKAVGA